MDTIAERSEHVFCRSVAKGGSGSTAPATALGVFHGIKASVAYKLGRDDLARTSACSSRASARSARCSPQHLAEAGAEVLVSDVNDSARDRIGLRSRRPGRRHRHRVRRLRPVRDRRDDQRRDRRAAALQLVAGAANNQLADPSSPTACTSAGSSTRPTT